MKNILEDNYISIEEAAVYLFRFKDGTEING